MPQRNAIAQGISVSPNHSDIQNHSRMFPSTMWTLFLQAQADPEQRQPAMQYLCSTYWKPLYCWIRRRGRSQQDAEDLVQAFFSSLLEKDLVGYADQERGRFRYFLLAAFKQFIARQHRFDNAAKRSPSSPVVSLDLENAERSLATASSEQTAPQQFERDWAVALIDRSMGQLQHDYQRAGKEKQFSTLRGFMTGNSPLSSGEAATQLGISENAVRIAVFRMKKRFEAVLRYELAQTLQTDADIEEELKELVSAIQS